MGRERRPIAEDAIYHLMGRGNGGKRVFRDDEDRYMFLRLLTRISRRYGWVCFGYCLMGNHFHLALRTPAANVDQGMRDLQGRYAWLFNQRHGTADHLFGRRYRSVVVESDAQLIAVVGYIARNPCSAQLVSRAEAWPWSSYPSLLGKAKAPPFFDPSVTLELFSPHRFVARAALRGLVESDDSRRDRGPIGALVKA